VSVSRTIIIGAGHAGSQCAISLRAAGYAHEICLIDADEADLPYHKPPLSKKYIRDDSQKATPLRPESAYTKADVKRINATVATIDPKRKIVRFSEKSELAYDYLVLATGAVNKVFAQLQGIRNVHSIRTLADTTRLRGALLPSAGVDIVGGGFIGLEVAACIAAMGKTVNILEAENRVLARVASPQVSARVQSYLESLGVSFHLGRRANSFTIEENNLKAINFDKEDSIKTELLVVGVGADAEFKLAKDAGLNCENGILVNQYLKTSNASIFAIGDCASFKHWQSEASIRLESVQNAVDQAKAVAQDIANDTQTVYKNVPWFWSDIGSLKLQIAGINSSHSSTVEMQEDDKLALYHLHNDKVVCVETINSARDHMLARKLIAADIVVNRQDIEAGPDALKSLLDSNDK